MTSKLLYLLYIASLVQNVQNQELHEGRIPPYFTDQKNTPTLIYNPSQIKCLANGIPPPTIQWLKDGHPIQPDGIDFEIKEDNSLDVKKATKETRGSYVCVAENNFGKALSRITVLEPASMEATGCSPEIQPRSVVEGETISLPVKEIISTPPSNALWYKLPHGVSEREEMSLNERMYIDITGILWFGYTLKEDSSVSDLYKGKRRNNILDKSTSCDVYNLTVSEAPGGVPQQLTPLVIHATTSPYQALEGRLMILECFIPSRPFERVKWSREDRKPLSERFSNDEWGFRLTVRNVKPEDEGEYVCQAGSARRSIGVEVQAAPVFVNPPRDRNVTEGTDVVVDCSTHAIPRPVIEWFMNNVKIQKDRAPPRMSISDDSNTLLIRNVCRDCRSGRSSDSMVIQCNASNQHGYTFSSHYINVLKKTEVKLTTGESYYEMETGYEKKVVVLNCSSTSDPLTSVTPTWFNVTNPQHREHLVSDNENMFVDHGLLIFNLTEQRTKNWKNYHGKYACVASSPYSNSTVYMKIFVKSVSPVVASILDNWWILLIACILILLMIVGILFHCLYNVGDTYNVNRNELKNGNNPIKEIEEKEFRVYLRPEGMDFRGSQATLISKSSRNFSDNGDDDGPGRFNEEGSFLGEYAEERRDDD